MDGTCYGQGWNWFEIANKWKCSFARLQERGRWWRCCWRRRRQETNAMPANEWTWSRGAGREIDLLPCGTCFPPDSSFWGRAWLLLRGGDLVSGRARPHRRSSGPWWAADQSPRFLDFGRRWNECARIYQSWCFQELRHSSHLFRLAHLVHQDILRMTSLFKGHSSKVTLRMTFFKGHSSNEWCSSNDRYSSNIIRRMTDILRTTMASNGGLGCAAFQPQLLLPSQRTFRRSQMPSRWERLAWRAQRKRRGKIEAWHRFVSSHRISAWRIGLSLTAPDLGWHFVKIFIFLKLKTK